MKKTRYVQGREHKGCSVDVSCPFPSWDGRRDISLPLDQFLQLPWVCPHPQRDPAPASSGTRPQISPHRRPHLTNSSAVFNTRVPRSSSTGRGCGCSPHPSSARPGLAPAARPILPSRLRPCRSSRRSSPGSAPPTCSPCQSRVSPSPRPLPVHPTHRAAGLITGRHPATHPSPAPQPEPLPAAGQPALPSETSPGAAPPEGSCVDFSMGAQNITPTSSSLPQVKSKSTRII